MTDSLSAFVNARKRLFGIAYRVLRNVAEAEDIVQEVWLRWQKAERTGVRDVAAFLATATTRLAINRQKSACVRREAYVGTWLVDPIDTGDDAGVCAERGEALAIAVSMLLEKLTPTERAAYVLREAFSYEYSRVAEILRSSEVSCRQLVARARKHIAEGRRMPVGPAEQRRLMEALINAAQHGDLATLERMFEEDVVSYSNGGAGTPPGRRTYPRSKAHGDARAEFPERCNPRAARRPWKGADARLDAQLTPP
jgi:RNA polymerase sigma-70 factor (ECF subfamily)